MEEVWKDIVDYEGLYQVSNLGNVKSLNFNHTGKEQILKPHKDKGGYLRVDLCKDGKRNGKLIHRLVAQAFIPNDDLFKTEINHKDENKENNVWSNLEWCDMSYNNNYGTHQERCAKARLNHPKLSKKVNQYSLDGKTFIQSFHSAMEIQRQLGFANTHISDCCLGKRKSAYGFMWKYKNDDE